MLRTADIIMILMMTAAATVTYSIKHRAELKLEEVRKLESEIRLERDTIDLLKADWALLTQPNRLQRLIDAYQADLQLAPTASTQLAQPSELPMLKADVPPPKEEIGKDGKKKSVPMADAGKAATPPAALAGAGAGESVESIIAGAGAAAAPQPATPAVADTTAAAEAPEDGGEESGVMNETDDMSTGSVEQ